MCGIGFTLFAARSNGDGDANHHDDDGGGGCNSSSNNADANAAVQRSLAAGIAPRGPDYQGTTETVLKFQHHHQRQQHQHNNNNSNSADNNDDDDDDEIIRIASVALSSNPCWKLKLFASVLHMRGEELTEQPLQASTAAAAATATGTTAAAAATAAATTRYNYNYNFTLC